MVVELAAAATFIPLDVAKAIGAHAVPDQLCVRGNHRAEHGLLALGIGIGQQRLQRHALHVFRDGQARESGERGVDVHLLDEARTHTRLHSRRGGEQPPRSAMPSQVISHVRIDDADWATTPDIPLNPGLVAIIGARGSGKTALVDVIAAGCDAITPAGWDADENISPSFLARARRLIGDATTTLTWGGGATVTRSLDGSDANGHMSFPRARYLSQQFVEELCSAKGVSDGLVKEIERVIFESHSQSDREWALDFAELRDQQTSRFQQAREREAEAISNISDRIASEFEKESLVASLAAQVGQKKKLIAEYTADRAKLVVKGTEAQVARHTQLSEAAQKLRSKIQAFGNQRRTFVALQDEVRSMRATGAPELLRQAQARHGNSGLNAQQWDEFLLIYKGDVDKSLAAYIAWADGEVRKLNGVPPLLGDAQRQSRHQHRRGSDPGGGSRPAPVRRPATDQLRGGWIGRRREVGSDGLSIERQVKQQPGQFSSGCRVRRRANRDPDQNQSQQPSVPQIVLSVQCFALGFAVLKCCTQHASFLSNLVQA